MAHVLANGYLIVASFSSSFLELATALFLGGQLLAFFLNHLGFGLRDKGSFASLP